MRGRIEAVLGWATRERLSARAKTRARWRDHLDNLLASRSKVHAVKHQPALPYAEMPAFIVDLHKRNRHGRART